MNRVLFAILFLFSTATVLYWQVQLKKEHSSSASNTEVIQPDFVASNLHSIDFNVKGYVASKVQAQHMEHFQSTNMTYFTQPIYLVYPDRGDSSWRIQAQQGSLNKTTGKVVLQKNVIIDAISPEEPVQELSTSYLELDLNTMIMTSDKTISVKGKDFKIKGKGLYADLNAQEVELTSQVEGIYEAK